MKDTEEAYETTYNFKFNQGMERAKYLGWGTMLQPEGRGLKPHWGYYNL